MKAKKIEIVVCQQIKTTAMSIKNVIFSFKFFHLKTCGSLNLSYMEQLAAGDIAMLTDGTLALCILLLMCEN